MIDKLGGRKFIFAVLAVVAGFYLVTIDKVTAEQWMNFTSIIGGIYVIGNVVSKTIPPQG